MLTVSSLFPATDSASAGETLEFTVSNVRNPVSATTKSGFTVQTTDGSDNLIDTGSSGSLTVTDPGEIVTTSLFQFGG